MAIFKTLIIDPDLEWEFIDGSIVKAHQHSTGAMGDDDQAIGKSVAGNTTKIHMVVESNGMPIEHSDSLVMTSHFARQDAQVWRKSCQ